MIRPSAGFLGCCLYRSRRRMTVTSSPAMYARERSSHFDPPTLTSPPTLSMALSSEIAPAARIEHSCSWMRRASSSRLPSHRQRCPYARLRKKWRCPRCRPVRLTIGAAAYVEAPPSAPDDTSVYIRVGERDGPPRSLTKNAVRPPWCHPDATGRVFSTCHHRRDGQVERCRGDRARLARRSVWGRDKQRCHVAKFGRPRNIFILCGALRYRPDVSG